VNGEGEHAPQAGDRPLAVLLVGVQDRLGVRVGGEGVAARHELGAQLAVVVDLAVEDDRHRSILVEDRLPSPREVDDAESPHPQADPPLDVEPLRVGAAVDYSLAHAVEQLGLDRADIADHDTDSAHATA